MRIRVAWAWLVGIFSVGPEDHPGGVRDRPDPRWAKVDQPGPRARAPHGLTALRIDDEFALRLCADEHFGHESPPHRLRGRKPPPVVRPCLFTEPPEQIDQGQAQEDFVVHRSPPLGWVSIIPQAEQPVLLFCPVLQHILQQR